MSSLAVLHHAAYRVVSVFISSETVLQPNTRIKKALLGYNAWVPEGRASPSTTWTLTIWVDFWLCTHVFLAWLFDHLRRIPFDTERFWWGVILMIRQRRNHITVASY